MTLDDLFGKLKEHSSSSVTEISLTGERNIFYFIDLHERVSRLRVKLTDSGVERGHVIGIQAVNSVDYLIWDIATASLGIVLLALTDNVALESAELFLNEYDAVLLISDKYANSDTKHVVPVRYQDTGLLPVRIGAATTNVVDLHSKVFSSGTTGKLKGINISRGGTEFVVTEFIKAYNISDQDRHVIFFPYSNYQQRMSTYGCIYTGADIVLTPYQKVFETIKTERPTFLIAPPVFFETALQLWEKVGNKTRFSDSLGGNIRFMITGMAPSKLETLHAYWSHGLSLYEAYGLTETGMVAWNSGQGHRLGSVGKPLNPTHIVLNNDGEIVINREWPLSISYFRADPEETANTYTSTGIATGDYGAFDDDGFLHLNGRKKDIIVLNNGMKFHPLEVEKHITRNTRVKEVIVTANNDSSRVIAIVPTASNDIPSGAEEGIRNDIIRSNNYLDAYKRVSKVIFTEVDVLRDSRFITRNMKLNRNAVFHYFT